MRAGDVCPDGVDIAYVQTGHFLCLIAIFLYSDFRHGQLVNAEPEMTCEDFINSGIYYKHFSQNDSPDKDHQPLIIDLVDKNDPNRLINREMYDLGIHIRSGEKNEPPGVDAESTLILVQGLKIEIEI